MTLYISWLHQIYLPYCSEVLHASFIIYYEHSNSHFSLFFRELERIVLVHYRRTSEVLVTAASCQRFWLLKSPSLSKNEFLLIIFVLLAKSGKCILTWCIGDAICQFDVITQKEFEFEPAYSWLKFNFSTFRGLRKWDSVWWIQLRKQ